jgi:superfamily I DNA and/or RNA helicase
VDTSDLPTAERAERKRERTETWQTAGFDNPAEARLILALVGWYVTLDLSWAVIVPYKAQVQFLTTRLKELLGDEALVTGNVGSVDSFQGGERDVICYGFTRSNPAGQIGFLRELRRINVAITRAKRQLVLVGDLSSLRAARDKGFRELIHALERHTAQHGEIHPSRRLADLLRDARKVTHG